MNVIVSASGSSKPAITTTNTCSQCEKTAQKIMRCGKCKVVSYCSVECQREAWPTHKKTCHKPPTLSTPLKPTSAGAPSPSLSSFQSLKEAQDWASTFYIHKNKESFPAFVAYLESSDNLHPEKHPDLFSFICQLMVKENLRFPFNKNPVNDSYFYLLAYCAKECDRLSRPGLAHVLTLSSLMESFPQKKEVAQTALKAPNPYVLAITKPFIASSKEAFVRYAFFQWGAFIATGNEVHLVKIALLLLRCHNSKAGDETATLASVKIATMCLLLGGCQTHEKVKKFVTNYSITQNERRDRDLLLLLLPPTQDDSKK